MSIISMLTITIFSAFRPEGIGAQDGRADRAPRNDAVSSDRAPPDCPVPEIFQRGQVGDPLPIAPFE
jgi:hypothetical protein